MGMTLWVLWSRDIPHTRQMGSWSSSQYSFSFSSCSSHISIRRGQCPMDEARLLMLDPGSRSSGSSNACVGSNPEVPAGVSMDRALRTLSTTLQSSELGRSLRPHDFLHLGQLDNSSALASQHWMMHTWQKWWPHSRITGSRNSSKHTGQVSSDWSSSRALASAILHRAHSPGRKREKNVWWQTRLVTSQHKTAFKEGVVSDWQLNKCFWQKMECVLQPAGGTASAPGRTVFRCQRRLSEKDTPVSSVAFVAHSKSHVIFGTPRIKKRKEKFNVMSMNIVVWVRVLAHVPLTWVIVWVYLSPVTVIWEYGRVTGSKIHYDTTWLFSTFRLWLYLFSMQCVLAKCDGPKWTRHNIKW